MTFAVRANARRWSTAEPIHVEGRVRTRVVVLGSGWAAATFVKNLSSKLTGEDGWYDVRVISPRWVQAPVDIAKQFVPS